MLTKKRPDRILYLLITTLLLSGCGLFDIEELEVKDGRADVSNLNPQSILYMDGGWNYYPEIFLLPGEETESREMIKNRVPSVWKENPSGQGFGTYRLELTGLKPGKEYSFYFFEITSAASYYINLNFTGRDGIPGKSKKTEVVDYIPSIQNFRAENSRAVLLIHISNFSMQYGGIWESVRFGESKTIQNYRTIKFIELSVIIGAMMIMGIYQFFLYFLNRQTKAPLWLSLTIILVLIKTMITGENILMRFFPHINQLLMVKFAILTVAHMVPFYLMFLHRSFPGICSTKILKINFIVSVFYSVLIFFLPLPRLQSIFGSYLLFAAVNLVYMIIINVQAVRKKHPGAVWTLLASILILSFALNDILYYLHIIQTAYLLNFGLLIFLLFQAFTNAVQNRHAYAELKLLRTKLEAEVEHRTEELKEERNKLEVLARNDTLTGLYNRNSSSEIFEREILRYQRTEIPFTVVMIDLDYFKTINDSYGHAAGDYVLKEFGDAVKKISRRTDYCFRWGGEEFLLLLPDTNEADARIHAEKLRQIIADTLIETEEQSFYITLSYGISSIYNRDDELVEIVNRADTALYRAKEEGRNRGYIYKKPKNS